MLEFQQAKESITANYENREFAKAIREIMALADKANKYIDEKEAIEKKKQLKKEKAAKKAVLTKELNELKDEFAIKVTERINKITANDEEVTNQAIRAIKKNILTSAIIRTKEKELDRPLEIEDFRKDRQLRTLVISNIVKLEEEQFKDILSYYQEKIDTLELVIAKLK